MRLAIVGLWLSVALGEFVAAQAHVPPAAPSHPMPELSHEEMMRVMAMDDTASVGKVTFDQLEWRYAERDDAFAWDANAWYGGDYDKLLAKFHGEDAVGGDASWSAELLWDRAVHRWWSMQTGLRHDDGESPSRSWFALGVQGLAPYGFEVEATMYVGEAGRSALRVEADYELLLTQRLVLKPELELNFHGETDPDTGAGSGLSDSQLALRLRYEIRREFAPYLGVLWTHRFGDTAQMAREAGADDAEWSVIGGLRLWF